MAAYICNICGEKHECDERPGECAVCGGADFRLEGERVSRSETYREPDMGDIDHLFARHNMAFPPMKAKQDRKDQQKFESDARKKAQADSEAMKKNIPSSAVDFRYAVIMYVAGVVELAGWASCAFTVTPIPWLVLAISAGIVLWVNQKSYDKYMKKAKAAAERVLTDAEDDIVRYNNAQDAQYRAYCDEFLRASQKLSEEYVGTEFVIRIAEWIFQPFDRQISQTNREERIAEIREVYSYSVYTDRIICGNGTYDFRGHGLRDVDDPVCQTALSIAIAAAVKILVMQKYPVDISGTPIAVSTEVAYRENYLVETMTYTAKNGNYNAMSVW
ncbi:MAG: hypothetical protein NC121_04855 [Blautia sp.]|nr:hypothetical protein [Blautia sp.]